MSRALGEVLEARGLEPIGNPRVEKIEYADDGPLVFEARVEVEPVIPEFAWTGLKGRKPRAEVESGEVEQEVNRLRELHAELVPIERGAEPGDVLIIDYERTGDVSDAEKGEPARDILVELGDPGLLPEMAAGLRGAVKGSVRTIRVRYPDDFRDPEMAGKELQLAVTVKELKEKRLPALDDDFARAAGGVETMPELRSLIEQAVQQSKERHSERLFEHSLLDALAERASFELPPSLVGSIMQDLARQAVERSGDAPPDFKDERVRELFQRMAEREVRRMFMTREVARRASLEVTGPEVEERLGHLAAELIRERGLSEADAVEAVRTRETVHRVADRIMDEKVMSLLRESAEVEMVNPS